MSSSPTVSIAPTYNPTVLEENHPWDFSSNSNPCFFIGVSCDCIPSKNFSFVSKLALSSLCLTGPLPSFEGLNNSVNRNSFDFSNNLINGSLPSSISFISGHSGSIGFLDFSNNKLDGIIDPFIFNNSLRSLFYLAFENNYFEASIPHTISHLTNIIEINFARNCLSMTLPESITTLSTMLSLDLSQNKFRGKIPSNLMKIQNMQILNLGDNLFTGNLAEVFSNCKNFTSLQRVNISNNLLSGDLFLDFHSVYSVTVDYSFNHLNGTISWSLAKSGISELYAANNFLKGEIPYNISLSSTLRYLDLSFNKLSGSLPPMSSQITNLYVQFNKLKGALPPLFVGIFDVDVSHNRFTGSLPVLINLRYNFLLHSLNISNNKVQGSISNDFYKSNPSLRILDLTNNSLTGTISESISELSLLNVLYLSGNLLKGSLPREIGILTDLQYLYLAANSFEGTLPSELQYLTNLQCIWLYENNFVGSPFKSLNFFTQSRIQIIDIGTNTFSGELFPASLSNLKYMKAFVSESNCFSDTSITDSFCNMANLKLLSLDGFKSSKKCRNTNEGFRKYLPFVQGFISYNGYMSIPNCIFQSSSLVSLHLSGNFIKGTSENI